MEDLDCVVPMKIPALAGMTDSYYRSRVALNRRSGFRSCT